MELFGDTVLPKLNLSSDIINDIKIAISQGKEVTTHTNNVSVPGWSGAGYIVINPQTGDGAYLISGGANGGFALIRGGIALSLIAILAGTIAPQLLLFGNISALIGLLMIAAASFVAAGFALLLGNKTLCYSLYSLAIASLTTLITATGLIGWGLRLLGLVGIPASATDACRL